VPPCLLARTLRLGTALIYLPSTPTSWLIVGPSAGLPATEMMLAAPFGRWWVGVVGLCRQPLLLQQGKE